MKVQVEWFHQNKQIQGTITNGDLFNDDQITVLDDYGSVYTLDKVGPNWKHRLDMVIITVIGKIRLVTITASDEQGVILDCKQMVIEGKHNKIGLVQHKGMELLEATQTLEIGNV